MTAAGAPAQPPAAVAARSPSEGPTSAPDGWLQANYAALVAGLDVVLLEARWRLEQRDPALEDELAEARQRRDVSRSALAGESAEDVLASRLGLGAFERWVLGLCLGFELDGRFRSLQAAATVGLALRAAPGADLGAFDAAGPLRRWELVELQAEVPLVESPLRLGNGVAAFLLGFPTEPDDLLERPELARQLPPTIEREATELARTLQALARAGQRSPVVELHGAGREDRRALAWRCADELGLRLACADVEDLPSPGGELDRLLRRWSRDFVLSPGGVCLELGGTGDDLDPATRARLRRAASLLRCHLFVSAPASVLPELDRGVVHREVRWPPAAERLAVWQGAATRELGVGERPHLEEGLRALADEYRVGALAIERLWEASVGGEASAAVSDEEIEARLTRLAVAARHATRARLQPIARRVAADHAEALVLPARQQEEFDELDAQIRLAAAVNRLWGEPSEACGVTALFSGPSGTGKTLAARLLAARSGRDLFRVDLAGLVSKYIGETEKNLARLFDAAEGGGAILLFDEAEALFGRRSEVKDSHDRYANVEVAYLLQRLEHARCHAVLTTNMKEAVDPAFVRRLRFVVEFPFPDETARRRIWETAFPMEVPTKDLDPARLARLAVTGATIRAIALRASFLAAGEQTAVGMGHLLAATRRELRKLRRELSAPEVADWA